MKKSEATKKTMTAPELKEAVASVWMKAHAFEKAWRERGEIEDDAAYEEQRPIVTKLAEEFVDEWEKYESALSPLLDSKTANKAAKKIGSAFLSLALYSYEWWMEAEGMLSAYED